MSTKGVSRWSTKDADEELALRVLRAALRVPVTVHDDRSGNSKYDLEIHYSDGRRGAAEVVSTCDKSRMSLIAAVAKRGYTKYDKLTRLWIVQVIPGTIIRDIASEMRSLLVRLEEAGIHQLTWSGRGNLRTAMLSLGIDACWSQGPTEQHPPGFYVSPDAFGGWVGDGDSALRFCEEFLTDENQADVLAKLNQEPAEERHAVVILTTDQIGPYIAIDTGGLPTRPPELPWEVDWLWVIASKPQPPVRAIYWGPSGQWSDVGIP
jgi:hypothetical protein